MLTNVLINSRLLRKAMRATGLRSKRQVAELGLQTLIQLRAQRRLRKLRGKLQWEGDLDRMRSDM
jgi:Arc/MetJ family transcription regulator